MYTLNYDGTFHGFLTVVFDSFNQPEFPDYILKIEEEQHILFPHDTFVRTNRNKALRVWKGIERKNSSAAKAIYFAFLSEYSEIELLLFRYIKSLFHALPESDTFGKKEKDRIFQLAQWVAKEKQRIEIFTRFEENEAGILQAQLSSKYNVLPLLSRHFKSQFGGLPWLIVDTKRQMALTSDGMTLELQPFLSVHSYNEGKPTMPLPVLKHKSKVAV